MVISCSTRESSSCPSKRSFWATYSTDRAICPRQEPSKTSQSTSQKSNTKAAYHWSQVLGVLPSGALSNPVGGMRLMECQGRKWSGAALPVFIKRDQVREKVEGHVTKGGSLAELRERALKIRQNNPSLQCWLYGYCICKHTSSKWNRSLTRPCWYVDTFNCSIEDWSYARKSNIYLLQLLLHLQVAHKLHVMKSDWPTFLLMK